jgi:hypothetical protein
MVKYMEKPIAVSEGEGGFVARGAEHGMVGTLSQIAWAVQIKSNQLYFTSAVP